MAIIAGRATGWINLVRIIPNKTGHMPISLPPQDSIRTGREWMGWLLASLLLLLGANFLRMVLAWLLMKFHEFFIQQNPFKS